MKSPIYDDKDIGRFSNLHQCTFNRWFVIFKSMEEGHSGFLYHVGSLMRDFNYMARKTIA